MTFVNKSTDTTGRYFVWDFGDQTAYDTTADASLIVTHTYNKDGRFSVKLTMYDSATNGLILSKTKSQFVTIYKPSTYDFDYDDDTYTSYNLTFTVSEDFQPFDETVWKYEWDFGDGSEVDTGKEVSHLYSEMNIDPGYTVVLKVGLDPDNITLNNGSAEDCYDTVAIAIKVRDAFFTSDTNGKPRIPNVFTPNRDGQNETYVLVESDTAAETLIEGNDIFFFRTTGEETFKFWVYNRWGNLVYKTEGKTISWDGKTNSGEDSESGVYYYVVESDASDKRHNTRGFIHLFRE